MILARIRAEQIKIAIVVVVNKADTAIKGELIGDKRPSGDLGKSGLGVEK